jgi:colanic acid/amylovoran biosynthesis glycosyltransferase
MRVAIVVPTFPQVSETFIANKFHGLLEHGIDVRVVCRRFERRDWERSSTLKASPAARTRITQAWRTQPLWLGAILFPLAIAETAILNPIGLVRYLTRGWRHFGASVFSKFYQDAKLIAANPTVLHFEFGTLALNRMYLGELLGCRVLVSFRGFDLNFAGLGERDFYRQVWDHADGIHCLGNDLWQRAQRRGCPADKRRALISPAIDTVYFNPGDKKQVGRLGTAERPLRILSVARLEWKKGHEFALHAVHGLRQRGIKAEFRIVGDGEYLEAVAFCRDQLGLTDCVQLLGAKDPEGVREQLAWADVFLHMAVSEGFCNAVLEAQAMCLPVVVSDADGLGENVLDGQTGFVVPRRDWHAAAEQMAELAKNGELRLQMGSAGRARVERHFRISDQIESFRAFYEELDHLNQSRDKVAKDAGH